MEHSFKFIIIFGFVLAIIAINRIFWFRRQKLWHETARLALEKGQPLPNPWEQYAGGRGRCGWGGPTWDLRRGLVLIAVGVGLYFGLSEVHHEARYFVAIPAFVGVALLINALVGAFIGGKNPPDNRPSNR